MMLIPALYLFICITLICLLLFFPGIAHEGTDLGVELFMEALFPYLLPYLILTQWFIRLTPNTSNSSSRFKLYFKTYGISALGGFPTGAATITYLKKSKQISLREANILLSICHSPSPLFVLGFVGNDLLNDTTFSWQFLILYHIVSLSILCGVFFYFRRKDKGKPVAIPESATKQSNPFTSSVKDSIPTVLVVGATIIFFTTIYTVVMHSVKSLVPDIHNNVMLLIAAMLEMTNGLRIGQELFADQHTLLLVLMATFLTSQGLSIHMQVAVIAKGEHLSLKPYILMRLIYVLLIPSLFYLLFL